ncbi:cop9 signalosome subunit 6 [Moniliophthora roreri MCA 2997]|uniref:COP9 signalosome complex subunit 6 n=1 Tax=Moniliophthora roreri (strain MCA 2997) TaxID=1381753 RepID=V2XGB1_MONRO|nr:cop9 signalosome subunit 6 [Moniliophthora roreri MCA 2997]
MSAMDTDLDELPVVLPSTTTSGLSISLHPLPILNISEHLTRLKLQTNSSSPFVLGALLGQQNGREVEIVNTFELAVEGDAQNINHGFLVTRRDQYKQVFPSLEFIGWYTVAPQPTSRHIALHAEFTGYCSTPLLLLLQPGTTLTGSVDGKSQDLPFKAYEATVEIRERTSRSVFIEAPYTVETGEAERIAVDWTARGGGSGTSLESHLQTQRAAVKMLHDRILVLVQYVTDVISEQAPADHGILRSISALIASLPASENKHFRQEFNTEYEDVQLTTFLSSLTKSTNILNDIVDKHLFMTASREDRYVGRRRMMGGRHPAFDSSWDRMA